MYPISPKGCSSVSSSPYSSPNLTALLKIKIISWSQETGFPVAIQVQVAGRIFSLHKLPLCSRSGYFKKHLSDNTTTKIDLPPDFPGGSETFEMIALFIYGSSTFIDPFNVVSLRCASEFLQMTSEFGCGNLCERTDLYLNQIVLQSWDDTLIVLQKCQSLLPFAEELLIDSRCIESLAFMACMEILDPEGRRDKPSLSLESLATQPWSSEKIKEIVSQDLWIKDLISLPFEFFKRVICSLRRQGMKEKYISPIIVFYANKWVISKKTRKFWECLCNSSEEDLGLEILHGILDLLPHVHRASKVIPVGFFFSLMERSIELGLDTNNTNILFNQIVFMLPKARIGDFLVSRVHENEPISSTAEFKVMINIFSAYVASNRHETDQSPSIVAELWDSYLSYVALDPAMDSTMFLNLIQTVPISYRGSHDCLYRAISAFLQAHSSVTQDEKASICEHLSCQKLSQEACIEAVQNEVMPLRLIVQALFVQQINTQQAFKSCSESFRYTGNLSGSISSSEEKREYESTSFRIHSLEKELLLLKKSLKVAQGTEDCVTERSLSNGCIGSVRLSSQRKYAGRILRVFQGMVLFRRLKPKRRKSV